MPCDQALSELERQAAGGRMIGVIAHVREVSERPRKAVTT